MKAVCVYCGSSSGLNEHYVNAAHELGRVLVKNNLSLVFGGGCTGLMGEIADSVLSCGGNVIGVIPRFLVDRELSHKGLSELIVVESMHERKETMHRKADGFIAMPGGFGTIEEIFEMITWGQLQLHRKPCAFLNVNGYYDDIKNFFNKAVTEGFIPGRFRDGIVFSENPQEIIEGFKAYRHEMMNKTFNVPRELKKFHKNGKS